MFICNRNYLNTMGENFKQDDYKALYNYIKENFGNDDRAEITVFDYRKNFIITVKDMLFGKGKKVTEPLYVGTDGNDYSLQFYDAFNEVYICTEGIAEYLKARVSFNIINSDGENETITDYIMVNPKGVVTSYLDVMASVGVV